MSSRRASPGSAITASSRIAIAPPTSQRRACSSDPHASFALAIPLPIRVSVLSATRARCESVLASTPSGHEHGSIPRDYDFCDLAFALPQYARSCHSSALSALHPPTTVVSHARAELPARIPTLSHTVTRSLHALHARRAPPPNPRGSILSPRRPAASSN